jgi:hypothetical protein
MPETQFPSRIQRTSGCQIGGSIRFSVPTRLRPVAVFRNEKYILIFSYKNQKAEVVRDEK